ncbi:MAG TPA: hypothetical protein EYP14_08885 [Planctomycetaceae bacterium]|nr:hypothetical protein [Planctomycetaceae bacterium]
MKQRKQRGRQREMLLGDLRMTPGGVSWQGAEGWRPRSRYTVNSENGPPSALQRRRFLSVCHAGAR